MRAWRSCARRQQRATFRHSLNVPRTSKGHFGAQKNNKNKPGKTGRVSPLPLCCQSSDSIPMEPLLYFIVIRETTRMRALTRSN
jgi:hypothetical protein